MNETYRHNDAFARLPGDVSALDVSFPPRNEPFAFRQQLETTYRDGLRRSSARSFVDIEGTIVWTQEYLRYRVNGCGHTDALSRVTTQILGGGIPPVCADFTGTAVNFPPRNEPLLFRQALEALYRDDLRRGAVADVRRCRRRHRLDAGIFPLPRQWLQQPAGDRARAVAGPRRARAARRAPAPAAGVAAAQR